MRDHISVKNERDGAVSILLLVHEDRAFLGEAAGRIFAARDWPESARRQIMRMARGTLERQLTLDALIGACASRGVEKIDPVARDILRVSVYCLYYMDSMPAHAVVSEAVELTKKRGLGRLNGFVNGVLRSVRRRQESGEDAQILTVPGETGDGIAQAEVRYSVPAWIIRQWCRDYGRDTAQTILEALYEERPLTARVNETRISREELAALWRGNGIECEIINSLKTGISFSSSGPVEKLPGFEEGLFYVQDFGSILAGEIIPLSGGERVIDLCAAPGGKACALAQRLTDGGSLLACDRSREKTALIRDNARRLGLTGLQILEADATEHCAKREGAFDIVLADVPCSGLGVIGRKPDIKLRLAPEDITSLLPLQRTILDNALSYVRPGGYVLYSTCTLSRQENEEQTERALAAHPECQLTPFAFGGQETGGQLQLFPGIHPSDGFYMALFKRVEEET